MLDHPTRLRQFAVLAALAVLIGIRLQALLLVGAVVAGVGIDGLRAPPFRRTLRVYTPLVVALAAGGLAATLAVAAGLEIPGSAARDVAGRSSIPSGS